MKVEDNLFPSILFDEQADAPDTPDAGTWRIYAKSDGLYIVDDNGTETGPFVSAGGSVLYPKSCVKLAMDAEKNALVTVSDALTTQRMGFVGEICTNDGDEAVFKLFLAGGTYSLSTLLTTSGGRGKFDTYMDGTLIASGDDTYSAATVYNVSISHTGISITGDGWHELKMKVNGKNGSASAYKLIITYVQLNRTGA